MKSQLNRDMMTDLYRMLERYEVVPKIKDADDREWLTAAAKEMSRFYDRYSDNEFAQEFALAFYNACSSRFAAALERSEAEKKY